MSYNIQANAYQAGYNDAYRLLFGAAPNEAHLEQRQTNEESWVDPLLQAADICAARKEQSKKPRIEEIANRLLEEATRRAEETEKETGSSSKPKRHDQYRGLNNQSNIRGTYEKVAEIEENLFKSGFLSAHLVKEIVEKVKTDPEFDGKTIIKQEGEEFKKRRISLKDTRFTLEERIAIVAYKKKTNKNWHTIQGELEFSFRSHKNLYEKIMELLPQHSATADLQEAGNVSGAVKRKFNAISANRDTEEQDVLPSSEQLLQFCMNLSPKKPRH